MRLQKWYISPRFFTVKIVCLANSGKNSGRCIAGIDTVSKKWIRPVSKVDGGALSVDQCNVFEGSILRLAKPLDIIDIGNVTPAPEPGQPENYSLASTSWTTSGQVTASSLAHLVTKDRELIHGTSDKVYEQDVQYIAASLCLIKVSAPRFEVRITQFGREQLRAIFEYAGATYNLSVTDTQSWAWDARANPTAFSRGDWLFTISLGGTFRGARYKLVACGLQI